MNNHVDKRQENKSQSIANEVSQKQSSTESTFQFVDNRPKAVAQRKLQEMANNSQQVSQLRAFQDMANNSPQAQQAALLQAIADNYSSQQQQPIQRKKNNMGLLDHLKTGMENMSGMSLDDGAKDNTPVQRVWDQEKEDRKVEITGDDFSLDSIEDLTSFRDEVAQLKQDYDEEYAGFSGGGPDLLASLIDKIDAAIEEERVGGVELRGLNQDPYICDDQGNYRRVAEEVRQNQLGNRGANHKVEINHLRTAVRKVYAAGKGKLFRVGTTDQFLKVVWNGGMVITAYYMTDNEAKREIIGAQGTDVQWQDIKQRDEFPKVG